jgi:hypothetical protein
MLRFLAAFLVALSVSSVLAADDSFKVSFHPTDAGFRINIDGQEVAEYVFGDEQIWRPYFKHIRTLGGRQVTRNCPPQPGDPDDHATMHPGLWLAFGDLSGHDFWRNKARVKHARLLKPPEGGSGQGPFSVRNSYEAHGQALCTEDCSITFSVQPGGYLIDWTSVVHSADGDFWFGDQEEMGLGIRVATPLAVVKGGEIQDSQGRKNGKEVWGKQADWCRYGGVIDGRQAGVVLMPDPANFRQSWFHARDYGLLVANPFGRNALTKGDKSRITVAKGADFRLRSGVFVFESPAEAPLKIDAVYRKFTNGK